MISKDYFLLAKQLYRGTVSFVRLAAGNNSTPNRQICLKTGTEITVIPWVLLLCETARMFHSADISYLITKEATANVYSQTHISIQITAFHRNVKVRAMSVIQISSNIMTLQLIYVYYDRGFCQCKYSYANNTLKRGCVF